AVSSGHNHAANGVTAHDMRVVIDLNAARDGFKAESFGKAFQQGCLAGYFRKLASQRLARILQCVIRELLFLAALRNGNGNAVTSFRRKSIRKNLLLLNGVRQEK